MEPVKTDEGSLPHSKESKPEINSEKPQEEPISGYTSSAQSLKKARADSVDNGSHRETYRFVFSSLWSPAVVNPANGKSKTFSILHFNIYSTAFWFATLGFFVAFLAWFAFSPLVPEAVKVDLGLTPDQVINSNLASLGGTVLVRLAAGPACDRFGPRKVLASLLIIGAIPSGLAALVKNIGGLEAVRFFISILGGTFVPTQAYTTAFFDTNVVGTANAFAGGWGNMGGGVTVAVMIGLFERFKKSGYTSHLAWRLCFVAVPVPCLLLVAALILGAGRDHPAGKWSRRHLIAEEAQARVEDSPAEKDVAGEESALGHEQKQAQAPVSVLPPTSEPLTRQALVKILSDVRVWMCAMCYFLTFGLETAMDAALPGMILALFQSETFSSVDAAYAASSYGLMNLFARPLGGIIADYLYSRGGLRAKIYWLLVTAFLQGISLIGLGVYVDHGNANLGGVIGFIVFMAVTGFAANGAAYAVYSHLQPRNNGTVAGIIGASGNLGGLMYTLIFKYQPGVRVLPSAAMPGGKLTLGKKFWIAGVVNSVGVLPFYLIGLRSDTR